MTAAGKRYGELEQRLLEGRRAGTLTEAEDDDLIEEMGDLWWGMSDMERALASERARATAQLSD